MAPDEVVPVGKTVREILQLLSTIPVLPSPDLAALSAAWSGARLDEDGSAFARELVRAGKVTKYQAAALYQGQPKGLAVGEYLFLDRLGAGATGTVYKARRRGSEEVFAVKVLNAAALRSPDAVKRFQREADTAIRLNHPNIARALEAGESEGRRYMVMELLEGTDLSTYSKKKGPLPPEEAVRFTASAARGLAYAHEQGIVHRDVKPGNLLLLGDGRIKVLDLGLARLADSDGSAHEEGLTQTGQVMGTIDYMAPEQALQTRNADARADIYGLGCTLYRLITGDIPYPGDSMVAKILAHRDAPIPSLRAKRPKTPAAVDYVLARMLAKRPENRYQTMAELASDLELSISPEAARLRPPAPEAPPQAVPVPTAVAYPMLVSAGPAVADGSTSFGASSLNTATFNTATFSTPTLSTPMFGTATTAGRAKRTRWPIFLGTTVGACAIVTFALIQFRPQKSPEGPSAPLVAAASKENAEASPSAAVFASSSGTGLAGRSSTVTAPVGTATVETQPLGTGPPGIGPAGTTPLATAPQNGGPVSSAAVVRSDAMAPSPSASATSMPTPPASAGPTGTAVASIGPSSVGPNGPAVGTAQPSGSAPSSTAAASPDKTRQVDARQAVPDEEAVAQAVKIIRTDLFAAEYKAAQTAPARSQLAETLLKKSVELADDPAGRYAMLREARDLAMDAGAAPTAADAAAGAVRAFQVEEAAWLAEGLERVVAGTPSPLIARQAAALALWKIDAATSARALDAAERLATCATAAARRTQDNGVIKFVADRQKQFAKFKTARESAEKNRAALAADPADPAANLAEGKRLALIEGKWPEAFKHLVKGSDATLRELAEKSSAAPIATDARLALGDLWWTKATEASSQARRDLQAGALYWYLQIQGQLNGLTAERVEKRITEARAAAAAAEAGGGALPAYVRLPLDGSVAVPLRLIQPGVFMMGSPESEFDRSPDEKRHLVLITKPFYMGVTEVTYRQFEVVTGQTRAGSDPETPWRGISGSSMANFLERINAGSARSYLRVRLPTEAEWEYAARAGTTTAYHWGEQSSSYWEYSTAGGAAQPVGGRKPNAWGLYDVAGNVAEHCAEVYQENYGEGVGVDPKGVPIPSRLPSGVTLKLVVRGGDYLSAIGRARSAARGTVPTDTTTFSVGVRIVCEVIGTIPAAVMLHDPPTFRTTTTTVATTVPGVGISMPPTSSGPVTTKPVTPPAIPAQAGGADSNNPEVHRALAEWVLQHGGSVGIRGSRGSMITGRSETLINYAPYQVYSVSLYSTNTKLTTTDLQYIAAHRWLTQMQITGQSLTPEGVEAIGSMPSLTNLTLNRSTIGDAELQAIARIASLNILYLDGCPISDAGLQHLTALPRLFSLHVERTGIGDAGLATIAKFPSLNGLYLDGCKVTDAGVRVLSDNQRLSSLYLEGTMVTDAGLADIGRMANLTSLSLKERPISDAGLRQLSGLMRMSTLHLERTRVTDAGLAALSGMSNLTSLYLNGCAVTGAGFAQLRMPRLSTLYLEDTQVTDASLAALDLPECRSLSLRRCRVTDNAVPHLAKLRALQYVYAYETQMTTTGGDRLRAALPDVKVYVQ